MKEFNFYSPTTLDEALNILSEVKGSVSVIAGGTDLVMELQERSHSAENIVSIKKIPELKYIRVEDGKVRIGALTTFTELENHLYIQEHVKSLRYVCEHVGSPQIRNLGTICLLYTSRCV